MAIEQGYASKEAYPFDKFKVSKFNTPTAKRAIEKEEILKIMAADLSDRDFYTRFSRDIFVFSYLGAGINFTDIALLKHSDIKKERIYYTRRKRAKSSTSSSLSRHWRLSGAMLRPFMATMIIYFPSEQNRTYNPFTNR